ncbi:hypothetical protein RMSM_04470 [Rhodopirellula maiorica SM1]|uniref:Uncharacterized protein n=1 Tax=Rhodopirellula maiorica SM1 TaxID=1265738 RepID=M5RHF6_9BACT|nr:hypothetical protein RMSM_04470 [Rhodopirellula maiorica SM1]
MELAQNHQDRLSTIGGLPHALGCFGYNRTSFHWTSHPKRFHQVV